jgi:predicted enzyme related to lactoylglutathione lyase
MITAVHTMIYTRTPDAARAFFKDILNLAHVDAGGGWLIFALPPAELGVHPIDEGEDADPETPGPPEASERWEVYFMCDDLHATIADLEAKGVALASPITDQGWGIVTSLRIPGGGLIALYQPRHATPPRS